MQLKTNRKSLCPLQTSSSQNESNEHDSDRLIVLDSLFENDEEVRKLPFMLHCMIFVVFHDLACVLARGNPYLPM
jgi:hypothetical protein